MTDTVQQLSDAWETGDAPPGSAFLAAGGEMATLIAGKDWAATSLGPQASWPRSLQTVLRILVTSRYAMWLGWGPELIFFYNDAYRDATLGAKHPWALGRRTSDVWAEIMPELGPRIDTVHAHRRGDLGRRAAAVPGTQRLSGGNLPHLLLQSVAGRSGAIGGMLCVVTEDTERVIGERRMATLRELAVGLAAVRTEPEVCAAIETALANNQRDLPFTCDLAVRRRRPSAARLACVTGIERGHPIAAAEIDLTAAAALATR